MLTRPFLNLLLGVAVATQQTQSGNAWDQADLLVNLLQQQSITARYVEGTIAISPDNAMRWLGTTTPDGAWQILQAAGLLVPNGSSAYWPDGTIQVKHAWVQAQLPLISGWIDLDPSWKFKDVQPGIAGIMTSVPFDQNDKNAYLQKKQSLTNPNEYITDSAQPSHANQLAYEFYEDQVSSYLAVHNPGLSLADVAHDGPILSKLFAHVPASYEYQVVGTPSTYSNFAAIPDADKHRVDVTVTNSSNAVLFTYTLVVPTVSLNEVSITFTGTGGVLTAQLALDNSVAATAGSTVTAGSMIHVTLVHHDPGFSDTTRVFDRTAGSVMAIALDAQQWSSDSLASIQHKINDYVSNLLSPSPPAASMNIKDVLAYAGAKYWRDFNSAASVIGSLSWDQVVMGRVGSGLISSDGTSTLNYNLQVPVVPGKFLADLPNTVFDAVPLNGTPHLDPSNLPVFDLLAYSASGLEGAIASEITNADSISTVKGMQLAANLYYFAAATTPVAVTSTTAAIHAALDANYAGHSDWVQRIIDLVTTSANGGPYGVTVADAPSIMHDTQASGNPITWQGFVYFKVHVDAASNALTYGYILDGDFQPAHGGASYGSPNPVSIVLPNFENVTTTGDPINVATGSVYHDETDISLPNIGLPLNFSRHYDSAYSNVDRGLGNGWMYSFSDYLKFDASNNIDWITSAGEDYRFTYAGGVYTPPTTLHGTMAVAAAGSGFTLTFTDKDGLKHIFARTSSSASEARLTAIVDRNQNELDVNYDGSLRITSVTDLHTPSHALTFAYIDGTKDIASVTDWTGRKWQYIYATFGGVKSLSSALNPDYVFTGTIAADAAGSSYDYFTSGALLGLLKTATRITEANYSIPGNISTTTFTYYPNRRGFEVTDAVGHTTRVSYDLFRHNTEFSDERGNLTQYFYDATAGVLLRQVNPDRTRQVYDWNTTTMLMNSSINEDNFKESCLYDSYGNVTQLTDRIGTVTQYTYETFALFSGVKTITVNPGSGQHQTAFEHDAKGNVTKITDAAGDITTMTYLSNGLLQTQVAPKGNISSAADFTTTYTYNNLGEVLTAAHRLVTGGANVNVVTNSYDAHGYLLQTTDATGVATINAYDTIGELISSTRTGQTSTFGYGLDGIVLTSTDPRSNQTQFNYNAKQQLVSTVFADKSSQKNSYDAAGNLVAITDEAGHTTIYTYDRRNRQIQAMYADGAVTRTRLDGLGNALGSTDGNGNTTLSSYDGLGHMLTVTDATQHQIVDHYDAFGNLDQATDRRGAVTKFKYDALNRVVETAAPEGNFSTVHYDANGNVDKQVQYDVTTYGFDHSGATRGGVPTDLTTLPLNLQRIVTTSYDVANRPTDSFDAAGNHRSTGYDNAGRVTSTTDALGRVSQTVYDTSGRVQVSILPSPESANIAGPTTVYSYDADGNVQSTTDPLGHVTTFTYDARNRQLSATVYAGAIGAASLSSYSTYDAVGNLVGSTDTGGHTTRITYDLRNRRLSTITPNPENRPGGTAQGTVAGPTSSVTYDAAGNVTSSTDALNRVTAYTYDALNRQISQSLPSTQAQTNWVVDDSDAGFSKSGTWNQLVDQYPMSLDKSYSWYTNADDGSTYSEWTISGLPADQYRIAVSLEAFPVLATNATYSVYDNGTSALLGTFTLDQTVKPADVSANGVQWVYLDGIVGLTGNSLRIRLSHASGTIVEADAVRVERVGGYVKYDANGNVLQSVDALGNASNSTYDFAGRRKQQTAAAVASGPSVTNYYYDSLGQLSSVQDALLHTTNYTYDVLGRRLTQTLPDPAGTGSPGPVTTTHYDAVGNVTDVTDALGRITNYTYDRLNRLLQEIKPSADTLTETPTTTHLYNAVGDHTAVVDALGHVTRYKYDGFRRQTAVIQADPNGLPTRGPVSENVYDVSGNVVATIDPLGRVTTAGYDALNRSIRTSQPDPDGGPDGSGGNPLISPTTTIVYDAVGNVLNVTDQLSRVTRYVYDDRNRRTQVILPDPAGTSAPGPTSLTAYDADSRVMSTTDPLNHITKYNYDARGEPSSRWGRSIFYGRTAQASQRDYRLGVPKPRLDWDQFRYYVAKIWRNNS